MTQRLTGSKLPIAKRCRWWLRNDVTYPELPRTVAAEDGVRRHALFSDLVDTGQHEPCSPSDEMVMKHLREFWTVTNRRTPKDWRSEVTFGLDAARGSAREVGRRLERDYPEPQTPGEIFLTTDVVGETPELVTVSDLKTGHGGHVEPPDDNLQLLSAGAAAFVALGKRDGAVLEIIHANEGGVFLRHYMASPLVLYKAMSEIALIQAGIEGARASAGEHCKYCPALGACPETGQMIGKLSKAEVQWTTEFVSEQNDAAIIEELAGIKKMIDALEDAVKERAKKSGGLTLSDGKVYRAVVCEKSVVDKALVEKLLGPRYAECTKLISYEQFKRVRA